jgi:hypothetical protein
VLVVPWAKHYQHAWEERSGDPNLPDWLRVAALAYGKHSANGHAVFGPGDLALVLGSVDPVTGDHSERQREPGHSDGSEAWVVGQGVKGSLPRRPGIRGRRRARERLRDLSNARHSVTGI